MSLNIALQSNTVIKIKLFKQTLVSIDIPKRKNNNNVFFIQCVDTFE